MKPKPAEAQSGERKSIKPANSPHANAFNFFWMKERSKSWINLFDIAARISAWKINGRRAPDSSLDLAELKVASSMRSRRILRWSLARLPERMRQQSAK